ncbi:MAG: endonuclease domain-containing protein [Candidatus Tectomicrobia bacterium]|uniref:Endonuclease domain-containing protein n=1 Tax=Tectimicrobiota bacterium TaxID=2528274 RepID=A0A933GL69_UNCTE|nr:endonuclease domain-containing protein [Candidatus Tectomicrobia bacterium]
MKQRARELRMNPTEAETKLWHLLRDRVSGGWKFRRQRPIGPFIVDFVCLEKMLVIEVDGGQHNIDIESDARRTEYLRGHGYQILRFWNDEVLADEDAILSVILANLSNEVPSP